MDERSCQLILVIGQGRLVEVARRALDDAGAQVRFLRDSTDRQIRRAMTPDVDAAMVICRDDRASLRLALVIQALRPGSAPDRDDLQPRTWRPASPCSG